MSTIMPIRRAVLATMGAAAMLAPASALAQAVEPSAADPKIAAAVEALRTAMVTGDGRALRSLVADSLTYGHSDGRLQDKADLSRASPTRTLSRASIYRSRQLPRTAMSHGCGMCSTP